MDMEQINLYWPVFTSNWDDKLLYAGNLLGNMEEYAVPNFKIVETAKNFK
jgi:hypothetical protein